MLTGIPHTRLSLPAVRQARPAAPQQKVATATDQVEISSAAQQKRSPVRVAVSELLFWTRKLGLSLASPIAGLFGVGSRGGEGKPSPSLLAPGGDIFTKDNHGLVELTKGTSNAAPMVAGAIALFSQAYPEASLGQKAEALLSTAEPIYGIHRPKGTERFA